VYIYEATLKGFDGSTDKTDNLIKWIEAETIAQATEYCHSMGYVFTLEGIIRLPSHMIIPDSAIDHKCGQQKA